MKKITLIIVAILVAFLMGSKSEASQKDKYFTVTKVAETPRTWDENGSSLFKVKVGEEEYMIVRMRGGLVVLPK